MENLSPRANRRSSSVQKDETFRRYLQVLGDFNAPYALQLPGEGWKTVDRKIADWLLEDHLNHNCWVGKRGSWYPPIFTLDFDHPKDGVFEQVRDRLQLSDGMFLPMTSPSFARQGNFHVALKLEREDGKSVTLAQGYSFLHKTVGDLCEVYPQEKRSFRLPFGRDQYLLSDGWWPIKDLSLKDELHYLDKVDPLTIDAVQQPAAECRETATKTTQRLVLPPLSEASQLWEHGLQAPGTRHYSQFLLVVFFARNNYSPEQAQQEIKRWIRRKHNQFSKEVNVGRWRVIDAEIDRQVMWVWKNKYFYPDQTHNLQGYVTRADLDWIVQTYPADVVNQKRLFELVRYYRPRSYYEWVYIPAQVWRNRIANDRTYKKFIADLEIKKLLRSNWSYCHHADPDKSFSRSFKLQIPVTSDPALGVDGRNLQEYYETLRYLFPTIRERVAYTKVSFQNFYNHEKQDVVLSLQEAMQLI